MADDTRALDLDAIQARAEAATYSPWLTGPSWAGKGAVLTSEGHPIAICGEGDSAALDAEFIAHSRQDVADLLAEVDRLRAEIGGIGARNAVAQSRAWTDGWRAGYGEGRDDEAAAADYREPSTP